jgi:hypothetical protein
MVFSRVFSSRHAVDSSKPNDHCLEAGYLESVPIGEASFERISIFSRRITTTTSIGTVHPVTVSRLVAFGYPVIRTDAMDRALPRFSGTGQNW